MTEIFQDRIPDNHCFGCGPDNARGLQIRSYWQGETAVCRYWPKAWQAAGPRQFLNGGIIATLIDCHCVCTAIADAYQNAGRAIGAPPALWFATGSLSLRYLHPVAIEGEIVLEARICERHARKTVLACSLSAAGRSCVEAELIAVRVPDRWTEVSRKPAAP